MFGLVACGSAGNGPDGAAGVGGAGGSGGTGGDGGSGGSGGSAGSGGAGGTAGGGGSDAGTPQGGSVYLESDSYTSAGQAQGHYYAGASFTTSAGCPRTNVDNCTIVTCPASQPPAAYESAGTIRLMTTRGMVSLVPSTEGSYAQMQGTVAMWTTDDNVTIQADGDVVPPFNGVVMAPAPVTLTMPTLPSDGSRLMVSRSAPLILEWTGTTALGRVQAHLQSSDRLTNAYCSFPVTSLAGVVSARVLGSMPAGAGNLYLRGVNSTTVTAGTWSVGLSAFVLTLRPDGSAANAPVMLQ
jgi:hypothetical protein